MATAQTDLRKKRKIAVLGSRSVGQCFSGYPAVLLSLDFHAQLLCILPLLTNWQGAVAGWTVVHRGDQR